MKIYHVGFITGNALASGVLGNLFAVSRRARLLEMHISSTGTAITVQLIRSISQGNVAVSVAGEAEDGSNEAHTVSVDRTFSTDPGTSGILGEEAMVGTQGVQIVDWEFYNQHLWIPVGNGIALKNVSAVTSQGHEVSAVWEE